MSLLVTNPGLEARLARSKTCSSGPGSRIPERGAGCFGTVMRKVLPPDPDCSSVRRPPIASTAAPGQRQAEPGSDWPRSHRCDRSGRRCGRAASAGTPGPVSITSTTASDGVSDRRSRTRPAGGVNLIALSTRLMSACRSTRRSARADGEAALLDRQRLPFFFRQDSEVGHDVLGKRREIHALERERLLMRAGTRQREQAIDQLREAIDFLEHAADDAAIRGLGPVAPQPDLPDAANRRQRRPAARGRRPP